MRSSGGWYLDQPEAPHAHWRRGRAGPLMGGVELFGLTLRREPPLPFGRGVVLPLPDEALLMSLEVGDALSDLVALCVVQIYRRHPVRFDNGAWHGWFDTNALRKRRRCFDERVKISLPVGHANAPQHPAYRTRLDAAMVARWDG
jgi:hypothetical protein